MISHVKLAPDFPRTTDSCDKNRSAYPNVRCLDKLKIFVILNVINLIIISFDKIALKNFLTSVTYLHEVKSRSRKIFLRDLKGRIHKPVKLFVSLNKNRQNDKLY